MADTTPTINAHFGSVRVYNLTEASVLYSNARRIANVLFGMDDLRDGERMFSVQPASGYLFYADYGELWKNTAGTGLPADKSEAEKIARQFIDDSNKKVVGASTLRQEGIGALFPSDIRPMWIGGIVPEAGSRPDHCLCQFGVFLPADRDRTGRVEGAVIDVRIGRDSKVIGLSFRWRVVSGDTLSGEPVDTSEQNVLYANAPLAIRKPEPGAIAPIDKPEIPKPASQDDDVGDEKSPEFLYWLADENAPQTFLAPVLLLRSDDEGVVNAASKHSLRADIWQRDGGEQIEVMAVVDGGSGDYTYQWGYWTHDTVFAQGIQLIGTSESASLERGVYNVLLHVRDRLTGAVVQTETVVSPSS